jgi:hypothetical protein
VRNLLALNSHGWVSARRADGFPNFDRNSPIRWTISRRRVSVYSNRSPTVTLQRALRMGRLKWLDMSTGSWFKPPEVISIFFALMFLATKKMYEHNLKLYFIFLLFVYKGNNYFEFSSTCNESCFFSCGTNFMQTL